MESEKLVGDPIHRAETVTQTDGANVDTKGGRGGGCVCVCVCVCVSRFLRITLSCVHSHDAPVFSSPMMLSLLIVEMMLKCTEYLLIRLSCSVTGRINQSRGQLCAYIFQAHLRTSGYEITVLSSQI